VSNSKNWRKSSYSGTGVDCVEVADLPAGHRAVRDSKDPDGGHLAFDRGAWTAFVAGVRSGEFA
jgi:hypothetical protein